MSAPLCRCICGSREDDQFDANKVLGDDAHAECEEPHELPKSHVRGMLLYDAASDQALRGVPLREEPVHLLSAEEEVSEVTLSLFVNGISFKRQHEEISVSFSPFALVRNCKFQATTSQGIDLSTFRCFKVSLFTQGTCFYFGIREIPGERGSEQAEEKRANWVLDISRAMRLVTQSLFPVFRIASNPVSGVPNTRSRIMAGYLAHHDDLQTTSVIYCELHSQRQGKGLLVLYENESCDDVLRDLIITERTTCSEKVGISCSCFTLEDHLFSARTIAERKLWLRAISNVKVKLQNQAPAPEEVELNQYRGAIQEYVRSSGCNDNQTSMDALLRRKVQKLEFPDMPIGYNQDGYFSFPAQPPAARAQAVADSPDQQSPDVPQDATASDNATGASTEESSESQSESVPDVERSETVTLHASPANFAESDEFTKALDASLEKVSRLTVLGI